jgi:hypothetical protein
MMITHVSLSGFDDGGGRRRYQSQSETGRASIDASINWTVWLSACQERAKTSPDKKRKHAAGVQVMCLGHQWLCC